MTRYFIMTGRYRDMILVSSPGSLPSRRDSWLKGQRFSKPPAVPLRMRYQHDPEGILLPLHTTACVMTREVREVLLGAGVDTLDFYDVVLENDTTGELVNGYQAFNVTARRSVADMARSRLFPGSSRAIDASFERLVLDEARAGGMLLFRLHEFVGAIVVHERVKAAVEAAGIPHIEFEEPESFTSA